MNDVKSRSSVARINYISQEYCTKQRIMPHSLDKNDQIALNSINTKYDPQAGFKIIKEKYPGNIMKQSLILALRETSLA